MGELHLEIIKLRLTRDYKVEVVVGKPKVSYRECITGKAKDIRGVHKKQSGGRGQFGDCWISVEPFDGNGPDGKPLEADVLKKLKWEDGVAFENKIVGGTIPKEFIPSVEYGIRTTCKTGVLAGFPLINLKVTLTDGSYHDVDSSQIAFELAGRLAIIDAAKAAGLSLLEPIMKLVVTTPKDFVGNVTGDLNRRRGLILDSQERQRGHDRSRSAAERNVRLHDGTAFDVHRSRRRGDGAVEVRGRSDQREERDPGREQVGSALADAKAG